MVSDPYHLLGVHLLFDDAPENDIVSDPYHLLGVHLVELAMEWYSLGFRPLSFVRGSLERPKNRGIFYRFRPLSFARGSLEWWLEKEEKSCFRPLSFARGSLEETIQSILLFNCIIHQFYTNVKAF